ncbi:sporulation protein YpjB [Bacillus sp. FJAT-27916]|uniref:sporulation protein YpjB n=1 Tax=Bacillus sp. FJAT-27916 TaxID=1679169 RepID=UPI000670CD80|nr:sporulation protein YpjB [Bacillus sp. FJAT-27916]
MKLLKGVIGSVIIVASLSIQAIAASPAEDKAIETIADQSLQFVKVDRRQEAEELLNVFSERFLDMASQGNQYSMDEINIVTIALEDAMNAVQDTEKSNQEAVNEMTKFRLAFDAVSHDKSPLWTKMRGQILEAVKDTREAVKNQDSVVFQEELNRLLNIYIILYPSLKIDVTPEKFQQVDAHLKFIDQYRPQVFSDSSEQKDMASLEGQLRDIFDEAEKDDTDPSLWWVIISTGSIILMTLSYVGFRKYKAREEITFTKKKNRDI